MQRPLEVVNSSIDSIKRAIYAGDDDAQLKVEDIDIVLAEVLVLRWRLARITEVLNDSNETLKLFLEKP